MLLARFAQEPQGTTLNARAMAESTSLPLPVVSKMLKTLAGADLLRSQRGAKGGYQLVREPGSVTVAELLEVLEGGVSLMHCTAGPGHCDQEDSCSVREPWQRINRAVLAALESVTLEGLVHPGSSPLLAIETISDSTDAPGTVN